MPGTWTSIPITSLVLLTFSVQIFSQARHVAARLTNDGLPDGQTVAPRGADFLHYTLPRFQLVRRKKKSSKNNVHSRATRPIFRHTYAPESPFYTLRDFGCASADIEAVVTDDGDVGLIRTVKARSLASPRSRRWSQPIFVLFHGGAQCDFSREFLPTWTEAARRLRANCLVAIDGATDSMMNYNLMVLGFPTVMRVRSEEGGDTFRGNRTVDDLISWVVSVGGLAPMDVVERIGDTLVDTDRRWLGLPPEPAWKQWTGKTIDLTEAAVENGRRLNWALLAANLVCLCYGLWGLVWCATRDRKAARAVRTNRTD